MRLMLKNITTGICIVLMLMPCYFFGCLSCEAFAPSKSTTILGGNKKCNAKQSSPSSSLVVLYAMGPIARAKKLADPKGYDRVVENKMKKEGLTRKQAEDEYNQFLENPSFYYALDKKEEYYKSLGYKDMFEGMIGEAEKEGKGDEVRERLTKFRQQSILKAAGVLITFVVIFYFARVEYWKDPDAFLPGI